MQGKPVVGTFGDDRLLPQSMKLDLEAGRVVWDESDAPFPEASHWPSTSYDRPRGYVRLQDVSLDDTPVELVLDTGSANTLWLGQQGKPGLAGPSGHAKSCRYDSFCCSTNLASFLACSS